jgi:hypothetical protein
VARWSGGRRNVAIGFHAVVLSSVDPGCSHLRHNRPRRQELTVAGRLRIYD